MMVMIPVVLFTTAWAEDAPIALTNEDLLSHAQALQRDVAQLEQENRGLRRMLAELEDNELYIAVDTENNQLTMRRGNVVLHTAICGSGSRQFVEKETGGKWYFETPLGSFTVLEKARNPIWIRPDWSYVEENMPIPPADAPERRMPEVLGKYALLLGNGYMIHGTKEANLLGTHFTHGCIALGDDDLELIYKSVKIGTKVYLY
jgi:L,D-transpeptidase ErfK/SrfK